MVQNAEGHYCSIEATLVNFIFFKDNKKTTQAVKVGEIFLNKLLGFNRNFVNLGRSVEM